MSDRYFHKFDEHIQDVQFHQQHDDLVHLHLDDVQQFHDVHQHDEYHEHQFFELLTEFELGMER
jgi:hypothetical protein